MVIEVKGWYPNDILGGDLENVMVMNRGVQQAQRQPIRLLGSGVRFVEAVEEFKESPQQLLALGRQQD